MQNFTAYMNTNGRIGQTPLRIFFGPGCPQDNPLKSNIYPRNILGMRGVGKRKVTTKIFYSEEMVVVVISWANLGFQVLSCGQPGSTVWEGYDQSYH